MSKDNTDKKVWRYFRRGDIVRCEEIWGKKLFEVASFHGNWYCPLMTVYESGKPKTVGNICNFFVPNTKLITSPNRPFQRLPKKALVKLLAKGNEEAKRELIMRKNQKL